MRPRTPGGGGALPAERLQGRGRPGPGLGARGRPGPGGSGTRTPARRDRARPRGGRRATLRTSVLGCPQVRAPRVSPPRRGHGGLSARSRVPNAPAQLPTPEPTGMRRSPRSLPRTHVGSAALPSGLRARVWSPSARGPSAGPAAGGPQLQSSRLRPPAAGLGRLRSYSFPGCHGNFLPPPLPGPLELLKEDGAG